jgi:hypothetical protein
MPIIDQPRAPMTEDPDDYDYDGAYEDAFGDGFDR